MMAETERVADWGPQVVASFFQLPMVKMGAPFSNHSHVVAFFCKGVVEREAQVDREAETAWQQSGDFSSVEIF